ncbi:MAG: heme-binding domain-containing protein [Chitinophaga sp.]|uniref:heme-binding domain-containing protein n=1 Tax=Chitinophaga sp. TaxID=1869181 RepID=UPI0025C23ACB|nr:heme-binding domain-containing protein [Chitinophaga sp.]MBV8251565.1 heme-binding domain-containing protein [Chitinophaga sp.]
MKKIKIILLVLLVALVVIQFIRPAPNESNQVYTKDFMHTYQVPQEISTILKQACYDCHSNNTRYPWYDKIQPVAWYLDHHIREAKKDLNFDEFGTYPAKRQERKLARIQSMVHMKKMPLPSYTWLHPDARLTTAQRDTIANWIDTITP